MATTADLMTLKQLITQEVADSLQRVREGMCTAINCRLDAISSVSRAMQRLSAGPADSAKPYKISRAGTAAMTKASSRTLWQSCTSGCKGERILVRVESVDKVERSTLAVDCTEADFRTLETAL